MPAPSRDRNNNNSNSNATNRGFAGTRQRFQNNRNGGREMPKLHDEGLLSVDSTSLARLFDSIKERDEIDEKMGFPTFEVGPTRVGWLIEMQETLLPSDDVVDGLAAVNFYFLDEDGGSFKAAMKYDPYFYLACKDGNEAEMEEFLRRFLEGTLKNIDRVKKEDLSMPNHLVGRKRHLLKLRFHNINGLLNARKKISPIITANKKKKEMADNYDMLDFEKEKTREIQDRMEEIYEYDVPYHVRVSIDNDIRVGLWYTVESDHGNITITPIPERELRADPVVLAYDIETTKAPLKFPDASVDTVMMISYMIDGAGYLITNREVVSQDIDDFEYTPKPEYRGEFTVFNEPTERDLLVRFFEHIKEEKPTVIATFNGDFFDWPFVEARAKHHGIDMYREIGFKVNGEGEYNSAYCAHLDCFRWVKRDSYLPQGSQGLKAVTTAKLGYNPIEIDPELMTPYAIERPQIMAEYSVSDAVATYYLYMKYVHPFIFSLCTIVPLNPDEVLRKGTGTLCEMLLMVQAYKNNILIPHKHKDPTERFYNGHLIESETYVGGHVESLEAGVFRSDLPSSFDIDTTAIDELISDLDNALKFAIEVEGKMKLEDVTNYDEVKDAIASALTDLKQNPIRKECPSIYHVDVASMYPNIITTNRLQPDAMVSEQDCASCDFNRPGKVCDRRLPWAWRGEFLPANSGEYLMIKNSFAEEKFPDARGNLTRSWDELDSEEQAKLVKKRLSDYSRKTYHRAKITETVEREAIICQRENPFYVNTVRDFRDRRYEFKGLQKVWKKKVEGISPTDANAIDEAKKMVVLYDSLQLAHKVILNSFYGYVMRKGSRWYSVEMAGVTCLTGATIIQMARALVERIGRPLELDTDGIWCILPKSFPEDFVFTFKNGKNLTMSYPCGMLNHLVHERFTNHQYQTLVDPEKYVYETSSDNSIFFEVDGPYKAMVLPTSKEEGKGLKKRYAVFNNDGSLAELKGFEIKRRGELRLIKAFQSQIFSVFLQGRTLSECYGAVAAVANSWLDILDTKGVHLENEDLMDLISENRSMSKTLDQYDGQKSTSICTARRLAEFLGPQMTKDAGLACKYIISAQPYGSPVTDRAVPVAIFSAELPVKRHYLRKWLKDPSLDNFDPRNIIDWAYYRERLASTVQKIITIPAALQGVANPVPRIPHPEWLAKKTTDKMNGVRQPKLGSYFSKATEEQKAESRIQHLDGDIEDIGTNNASKFASMDKVGRVSVSKRKNRQVNGNTSTVVEDIPTLPSEEPSLDDYAEWLKYSKIKWKIQELARKRRRQLFGESRGASTMGTLEGAFRGQNETAFSSTWQILQYVPSGSDAPGETRVFAFINDRIQTVRIKINRIFYLNFRPNEEIPEVSLPNAIVEQSKKSLPNGHVSGQLFMVTMPEADYQKELAKPGSILNHQHLEGIYESHISSNDRALLDLGSACSVVDTTPGLLGKGLENGFHEEWLRPVPPKKGELNKSLVYIHLLHIIYHEYEIFALLNTWSNAATVYVLRGPHAPRTSDTELLPNLGRVYKQYFDNFKQGNTNDSVINFTDAVEFEQLFFDSPARLYQRLSTSLSKMHSEKSTKAILCLQSPQASRVKKLIRNIAEFPTVEIRAPVNGLPAIGWQVACSQRIIKCFFALDTWIHHFHDLSVYGNIPIGNLKCDDVNFLIDVAYARKLQASGIILWWSRSPTPDEGGVEKDSILPLMDNSDLPEINNPALYTKVCVDMKIRNLAVNTICTAALLNEKEGVDLASIFVKSAETNNMSLPFLENAFSSSAMAVLSTLVHDWWSQAVRGDEISDAIINSFVSWVSSSSSVLYDHTLFYHVQNLSKKAFIQLIGEFRRAGSEVVFADEHRFIVCTNKNVVENTYSYANYLIKVLRGKPLFHFLDIGITEYWDTLLWMDKSNYAGRSSKEESENVQLSLAANWHLKNFLPVVLQDEFDTWVSEFLALICRHRDEQRAANGLFGQYRDEELAKSSDKQDSLDDDYFGKGILRSLDKPLCRRISQLQRRYMDATGNPDIMVEFEIPQMAGSYQSPSSPILQFVKFLCAVLNIPKDMVFESQLIRRHMLEVVDVKEFSSEAIFEDPCRSLKLSKVICDTCRYIRDIDFCKDDEIMHLTDGHYAWLCENCGREYDRLVLEERLIQSIQHLVTKFQVQDLKCEKCKKVRDDFLSLYCECSGKWVPTVSHHQTMEILNTYKQVAGFYNFRMVEKALDDINV